MTEQKTVIEFPKSGVALELPESTGKIAGTFEAAADICGKETGLAVATMMYFPKTAEEYRSFSNLVAPGEQPDAEALQKGAELLMSGTIAFNIVGFDSRHTLESVQKIINPEGKENFPEPVLIGSKDGFTYYLYPADPDEEGNRKKIDTFPPEMKDEYLRISRGLAENLQWFVLKPRMPE